MPCLNRPEHHGILDVGVDDSDSEYLESMLDRRGTARPETSDMGGLLSGLGDIAGVNGDGQPLHSVLEPICGEVHVEAHPVEVLAESLPITLFPTSPVASELKEIYLSRYAHD